VLSDSRGRLYEKNGLEIRPLGGLFAGPGGEVFEQIAATAVKQDAWGGEGEDSGGVSEPEDFESRDNVRATPCPTRQDPLRKTSAFTVLFPEPGILRQVSWMRFRTLLWPLMSHPEKLRAEHRLACHVQVYEAGRRITTGQLARLVTGYEHDGVQFRPLTGRAAAALGLPGADSERSDAEREATPAEILSGECVFRLQLARDPTAGADEGDGGVGPESGRAGANGDMPMKGQPRRHIPEKYLKPWEFRLSREEAVYDLNQEARRSRRPISSLARRVRWFLNGRRSLRKWMALISGKPLEEQLWSVRPPDGSLTHPAVRGWAEEMLTAAGYDSGCMLLEWEVFWRRKGI
jgi:hypothetical protein